MEITKEWLNERNACREGLQWFMGAGLNGKDGVTVVRQTLEKDLKWANWLVVRLMTHEQQIQYAIYAAESVLKFYEAKYPEDKRPREAIEAAKKYLADKTEENRKAAYAAAYAALAAAYTAYAAAYAALAAAYAAYAAAYAALASASAAAYAALAAAYAAYAALAAALKGIIEYGIALLGKGEVNKE